LLNSKSVFQGQLEWSLRYFWITVGYEELLFVGLGFSGLGLGLGLGIQGWLGFAIGILFLLVGFWCLRLCDLGIGV
jgi:hypothetical protein